MKEMEVSICCGVERSQIYPRDCWRCGALFVPIKKETSDFAEKLVAMIPKYEEQKLKYWTPFGDIAWFLIAFGVSGLIFSLLK